MQPKKFGEPLPLDTAEEVTSETGVAPGLGWEVSAETFQEIEEIEANIRSADLRSLAVIFG
ncbi:hypothetical protein [Ferrovibrio sp.]|uniref:hypothetical protein n=1 Tax=Ferrovibrio sp. TaxID=1917215 RepID=UPI000CB4E650|nr:hypothetical protein [Ferrovibrio sp.]PJI38765.1 MAG: hypothetical protein CTR53_16060 [Ferrovibrio sp.]